MPPCIFPRRRESSGACTLRTSTPSSSWPASPRKRWCINSCDYVFIPSYYNKKTHVSWKNVVFIASCLNKKHMCLGKKRLWRRTGRSRGATAPNAARTLTCRGSRGRCSRRTATVEFPSEYNTLFIDDYRTAQPQNIYLYSRNLLQKCNFRYFLHCQDIS